MKEEATSWGRQVASRRWKRQENRPPSPSTLLMRPPESQVLDGFQTCDLQNYRRISQCCFEPLNCGNGNKYIRWFEMAAGIPASGSAVGKMLQPSHPTNPKTSWSYSCSDSATNGAGWSHEKQEPSGVWYSLLSPAPQSPVQGEGWLTLYGMRTLKDMFTEWRKTTGHFPVAKCSK
jgi:hypothetical protein